MKIVLIGFMGSGKTTVAKLVAKKLSIPCYEVDDYTTKLTVIPIAEFVDKFGEAEFRRLEKEAIISLKEIENGVISTGGGSILDPENLTSLSTNEALIIYLKTSFDTIQQRLANNLDRPLFRDLSKAELLYKQRAPLYEKLASVTVETDNLTPYELSERIINL